MAPTTPLPDITAVAHARFPLRRGPATSNGATPWFTELALGTPGQSLRFMLDTGTINTWVTDSRCDTQACRVHRRFDRHRSSTFKPSSQSPHGVDFGPWGTMEVVLGHDLLRIERERAEGAPDTVSVPVDIDLSIGYSGAQFAALDGDGGIAMPSCLRAQPTALLQRLAADGTIAYPIAAFDFGAGLGEPAVCLMGAVDTTRFDPCSINTLPLERLEGGLAYLWTVRLEHLECAGRGVVTAGRIALDTGSSRFKGGHAVIERLRAAITDDGRRPSTVSSPDEFTQYPDLVFALGDRHYTLPPRHYFQHLGPSRWELAVHYLEGLPDELLVAGSLFLETVYSVFCLNTDSPDDSVVVLADPTAPR